MAAENRELITEERLDAALKKYGDAEPRTGLEGRVLANLRAERERMPEGRWSWSPAILVLVAIMVGAGVFLAHRRGGAPDSAAKHSPVPVVTKQTPALTASTEPENTGRSPALLSATRGSAPQKTFRRRPALRPSVEADKEPRQEQFPSPQPLSEQEKMLASYVSEWPQEAQVVARARTDLRQQALLELEKRNHVPEHSQEFER